MILSINGKRLEMLNPFGTLYLLGATCGISFVLLQGGLRAKPGSFYFVLTMHALVHLF